MATDALGARLGRLTSIVTIVTALVTSLVALSPATATPTHRSTPSVPPAVWTPCGDGYSCAEVQAPLDYDHPSGPTISLALAKLPATDPAQRIGSLFLNPGGPGGSGIDFLRDFGPGLFTPEVRARFDLVGFDPRGLIRSNPLRCFDDQEDAAPYYVDYPYPNTRARERTWIAADRFLIDACAGRHPQIMDHMSTGNVARDLDLMRQAVGDRKLTYYGISYGSFLGNVYANMFPDNFRALVIDGVLDPIDWTTGRGSEGRRVPFSARLSSAAGSLDTLQEFFRLCDAGAANCAFAPKASQRYRDLYRALRRNPLVIPDGAGSTVRYDESFLVRDSLGPLYDSASWPEFAALLAELETAVETGRGGARLSRVRSQVQADDGYRNYAEGFPGVACTDSVNPPSVDAWVRAAATSLRRDGIFGQLWTWSGSPCADWPGRDRDRYLGPFTRRTTRPVLVVGNLHDPATDYQGARTVDRLLPNSRLLTVRAWAHTSLFQSACADRAIGRYLLTSQLPARGTVCQPNAVPFAESAGTARRYASERAVPTRPHW